MDDPPELSRHAALGIGGFQALANSVLLLRGLSRLSREFAKENATTRVADLLRTAWVYGNWFAQARRPGLLAFSALSLVLIAAVWLSR